LIWGGLSGEFVLRGTDSNAALVVVGILWLIYDISQFFSFKNLREITPLKNQRSVWSILFFLMCGIYIICDVVNVYLLLDELKVPAGTAFKILALCGNVISVTGIILLLIKKKFGIVVALVGSAVAIAFTTLSGIFIRSDNSFHTSDFILFVLMSLLPGLILCFFMKYTKKE
jgi:hypothetical protein